MRKILFVVLMVMLVSIKGYCQNTAQKPKELNGAIVPPPEAFQGTVKENDFKTRTLNLVDASGRQLQVNTKSQVQSLELKEGDEVTIRYRVSVKIKVGKEGVSAEDTASKTKVVAIDKEKGELTLKGSSDTVKVRVNKTELSSGTIKVGDTVYVKPEGNQLLAVEKKEKSVEEALPADNP